MIIRQGQWTMNTEIIFVIYISECFFYSINTRQMYNIYFMTSYLINRYIKINFAETETILRWY